MTRSLLIVACPSVFPDWTALLQSTACWSLPAPPLAAATAAAPPSFPGAVSAPDPMPGAAFRLLPLRVQVRFAIPVLTLPGCRVSRHLLSRVAPCVASRLAFSAKACIAETRTMRGKPPFASRISPGDSFAAYRWTVRLFSPNRCDTSATVAKASVVSLSRVASGVAPLSLLMNRLASS